MATSWTLRFRLRGGHSDPRTIEKFLKPGPCVTVSFLISSGVGNRLWPPAGL